MADGNDLEQLEEAFNKARAVTGKPAVLLAKTVKGKGVSYMEDQAGWHGAAPNDEQYEQAMSELRAAMQEVENNG